MTEPIQVYEGEGNNDQPNRVHAMVDYLLKNFPDKFDGKDREQLIEQTKDFLDRLAECKAEAEANGQDISSVMALKNAMDKKKKKRKESSTWI